MRIKFSPESLQLIREKRIWWQRNRHKAPRLFAEELATIIAKLRRGADADRRRFGMLGGETIWCLLMRKTRNHVYYWVNNEAGIVEIVSVWNATAGAPPEL